MHGFPNMGTEAAPAAFCIIDPCSLHLQPVPERRWIVQDWLPYGYVTALYGDGGTGKTLVAQQLMTACATGRAWCGVAVEPCKVFGLFCEDDADELHRRQDKINSQIGIDFDQLSDMRWVTGVGADNRLITFDDRGSAHLTERYINLTAAALEFGAKLVVIDTAADTFGGNENNRAEVRQFIGMALNRLAIDIGGAVLLNAHPSRSGMSVTGDMDGGSTAWSNTVRSRWSLVRPKADDDAAADANERILTRRKANYSSIGDEIRLRWVNGVLVPVQRDGNVAGAINRAVVEAVFLDLLDAANQSNRRVSDSKHAGNYAPKLFAKSPNAKGYKVADFVKAMEGLFADGAIRMEIYGRASDARQCLVRGDETTANEAN